MSEHEHAIILANKVLDRVNGDPDDDLAVLSRQLLRAREQLDALWHFSACPLDHCERCIRDEQIIRGLRGKLGPATDLLIAHVVRAIGKRHSPTG